MLPFLLGVGIRKFSIDIINTLNMQRLVASHTLADAKAMSDSMLGFGRISEVEAFLKERNLGTK